jgi:hypothetical protein
LLSFPALFLTIAASLAAAAVLPVELAKKATLNTGRLDQVWRCHVNPDLVDAIAKRRLIAIVHEFGRSRIIEPHDYGIRGGVGSLLGFQISGESRSGTPHGWKHFELGKMRRLLQTLAP